MPSTPRLLAYALALSLGAFGCSSSAGTDPATATAPPAGGSSGVGGGSGGSGAAAGMSDAGGMQAGPAGPAGPGGGSGSPAGPVGAGGMGGASPAAGGMGGATQAGDDGVAMRPACSTQYGSSLTPNHGRLDGYLVAIIPVNDHQCHGDAHHVHLQVKMMGEIYDIAVNVLSDQNSSAPQVYFLEHDAPLHDGAWQEGWHDGDMLDYAKDLGVHAGDFASTPDTQLSSELETLLASANHVSIFGTGYTDSTGAHLIHRKGNGNDGAIVIDPLSPTAHYMLFHFATQSF